MVFLAWILLVKQVLSLWLLNLLRSGLRLNIKSPKMPRSTKNSAHVVNTSVCQNTSIVSQESSSSDVEIEVQRPQFFQPFTSQPWPFEKSMCMPYIKGPKMDWTLNDSLYHRFLKWELKCENILDHELAMLSDSKKCKKVIAWSRDFGMHQYVSWCLPPEDLRFDVIWGKFEDFCKQQTNEVRAKHSFCGWVAQLCTSPGVPCQVPTRNWKYLALGYFLVFLKRWGVCFQNH